MPLQQKTLALIIGAKKVLAERHPLTQRQLHDEMVSRGTARNAWDEEGGYLALARAVCIARRHGMIPWEWITDSRRKLRPTWAAND